jgi:guanyl-specific ribonuclease Sa
MKTSTLLLLAAFLGAELVEASVTTSSTASSLTSLSASASDSHSFAMDTNKRRKRRKSRPAYRRLGGLPLLVEPHATA